MKWIALLLACVAVSCSDDPSGVADNGSDASTGSGGAGGSGGSSGTSAAGSGGGGSSGTGGAITDLCAPPAGDLLLHGSFEQGMDGQAPAFWQVRDPAAPSACAGSGQPIEHVFLTSPAPGCNGQALAIDARGQWDCYAVQRASDYDTIEGGATYRISAAVRSSGNSVNPAAWFVLGVQWLDANDQFFGDEKNPPTASATDNDYDWKLLSFDLVAPANARRILVWLSAHYPGRVDFDNVSVVKL